MNPIQRIYVWDLPVRLFHWLLVALLLAAYLSATFGHMDWHQRIGLSILGLVSFRLAWGFLGSRHARFADFVRGPRAVRAHLRGHWRGLGHSPLGGWSVLMLLAVPLGMVGSGLFANDDIAFQGPLAGWVDKATSDLLTRLHHLGFNVLLALIALHLAAIVFYRLARRQDLVTPMITGWKTAAEDAARQAEPAPPRARWAALVFSLAVAAGVVYGVLALQPPPPPPVPAEALPDW